MSLFETLENESKKIKIKGPESASRSIFQALKDAGYEAELVSHDEMIQSFTIEVFY